METGNIDFGEENEQKSTSSVSIPWGCWLVTVAFQMNLMGSLIPIDNRLSEHSFVLLGMYVVWHSTIASSWLTFDTQQDTSLFHNKNHEFEAYKWLHQVKFDDTTQLDTRLNIEMNDTLMLYPPNFASTLKSLILMFCLFCNVLFLFYWLGMVYYRLTQRYEGIHCLSGIITSCLFFCLLPPSFSKWAN